MGMGQEGLEELMKKFLFISECHRNEKEYNLNKIIKDKVNVMLENLSKTKSRYIIIKL